MKMIAKTLIATSALIFAGTAAQADDHAVKVVGANQDVSAGTVTADRVTADANGWLVVHQVKPDGKPGPVVGHSPLKSGENTNVSAILTEPVSKGAKLMLMLHGETGGTKTGIFEYTLGAKEDGPIKVDGNLVMAIIEAQ